MRKKQLRLCCLDEETRGRCGCSPYWYTVTEEGGPLTAFETRAALLSWLCALGLVIEGELPEHGTHASMPIIGEYRRELCMVSEHAFSALPGLPVPVLDNGRYTTGKLHVPEDGLRVLYVPNCNCKWRAEHNYQDCRRLHNEGLTSL